MTSSIVNSRREKVRAFGGRALGEGDREKLAAFIKTVGNPSGIPLRSRLLHAKEHGLVCPVMRGAALHIAAKIARVPHSNLREVLHVSKQDHRHHRRRERHRQMHQRRV